MKHIVFLLWILSLFATPAYAKSPPPKFVGVYQGAPGTLNSPVPGSVAWPNDLPAHPTLGKYYSGGDEYINWSLDRMAELGIDFIVLDQSNGIHMQKPPLEADLLKYMNIVDSRISRGIPTPKVTLMTPIMGMTGSMCNVRPDACIIGEADWIWQTLVNKNGSPRPGWFWLNGKPLLGIYTVNPFTPTFIDDRYTIRNICNAQSNECHQPQKDLGNVWFWSTRNENGPLYSSQSEEITIQNGFDNSIACKHYFPGQANNPSCIIHEGFTPEYYSNQWDTAISKNPQIIVITSFGGNEQLEGGQIEQRTDFSPPTVYEDMTKDKIAKWKGVSTGKPGDLNTDGHVDQADLALVKSGFGTKYTIFDYNTLVANFGK